MSHQCAANTKAAVRQITASQIHVILHQFLMFLAKVAGFPAPVASRPLSAQLTVSVACWLAARQWTISFQPECSSS